MSKRKIKHKNKHPQPLLNGFARIEAFLDTRTHYFAWGAILALVGLSALLFSMVTSVGGDDSAYVLRAYNFVAHGKFPQFQAPLYPILLSAVVAFSGINLLALKLLSFVSLPLGLYFFYRAYHKRVSSLLLVPVLVLTALNAYWAKYGSQTYSEAFFWMLQALFFWIFFSHFIRKDARPVLRHYIGLGAVLFALAYTKHVGFAALIAVLLYFALFGQWKKAGFSALAFAGFYALARVLRHLFWNVQGLGMQEQASTLWMKDPYHPEQGTEDLWGFVMRLLENTQLYLSKHLFIYWGFRPEFTNPLLGLTIVVVLLLVTAALCAWFRKHHVMVFTALYLAVVLGATFIVLQARWDALRLVITYIPFLSLLVFGAFYEPLALMPRRLRRYQFLLPLVFLVVFIAQGNRGIQLVRKHLPVLGETIKGNKLAAYTPDWQNYIRMCQWAAARVPAEVSIAARKPNIAFIYTKRKFRGIYTVPVQDGEELRKKLKDDNVGYVVMASLRKYEKKKTQYTINTVKRYLYHIQDTNPGYLELVHTIGTDEKALLWAVK